MRGILIDSGKPPEIRNVPDTAQGLDAYLGGSVRVKLFSTQPAALAALNWPALVAAILIENALLGIYFKIGGIGHEKI